MGSFVTPICRSCENPFKSLLLGSGFINELSSSKIPYGCYHCGTIVSRDFSNPTHKCSKCKRELLLFGKFSTEMDFDFENIFDWNIEPGKSYILKNEKYDCPKCKTHNLIFENTGMWD